MTETLFGLRIPFVIAFAVVAAILAWLASRSSQ
jgi:hypothetical protein